MVGDEDLGECLGAADRGGVGRGLDGHLEDVVRQADDLVLLEEVLGLLARARPAAAPSPAILAVSSSATSVRTRLPVSEGWSSSCTTRIRTVAVGGVGIRIATRGADEQADDAHAEPQPAPAADRERSAGSGRAAAAPRGPWPAVRRSSWLSSSSCSRVWTSCSSCRTCHRGLDRSRGGRLGARAGVRRPRPVGDQHAEHLVARVGAGLGDADQLPRGPGAGGDHDERRRSRRRRPARSGASGLTSASWTVTGPASSWAVRCEPGRRAGRGRVVPGDDHEHAARGPGGPLAQPGEHAGGSGCPGRPRRRPRAARARATAGRPPAGTRAAARAACPVPAVRTGSTGDVDARRAAASRAADGDVRLAPQPLVVAGREQVAEQPEQEEQRGAAGDECSHGRRGLAGRASRPAPSRPSSPVLGRGVELVDARHRLGERGAQRLQLGTHPDAVDGAAPARPSRAARRSAGWCR